jgi:S-adenosylmethionine:tRNA ribosyltransferase-isomerase
MRARLASKAKSMLKRSDYYYSLPERLIAQTPPASRDGGRLLVVGQAGAATKTVATDLLALPSLLQPDDLLVVNDTRVVKARLRGIKDTGGAAELLLERQLDTHQGLFQVKVSKPLQVGRKLRIGGLSQVGQPSCEAEMIERSGVFYQLRFDQPLADVLDAHGAVPLPPYVQRAPVHEDERSYQTLFARAAGAVAAPTAGLHFSEALLERIAARGVQRVAVTLHVGAGTFTPMRADQVHDHKMHSERLEVSAATVAAIKACRQRGGRVVAVGTTVVRALEAVQQRFGELQPFIGETDIFITPGFQFGVVDALLTNFHLPESTLLMLVCAFGGYEQIMSAYGEAVDLDYRFFSYGDAMFVERLCSAMQPQMRI